MGCLDEFNQDALNWRPAQDANSLYVLATHILASCEESILEVLGGRPVGRTRDEEFLATGVSAEPIQAQWARSKGLLLQVLGEVSTADLDREYDHRLGRLTGRQTLILVVGHSAEHLGHAELTRDLLKSRQ